MSFRQAFSDGDQSRRPTGRRRSLMARGISSLAARSIRLSAGMEQALFGWLLLGAERKFWQAGDGVMSQP